ncbi:hypothetical protein JCM1841_000470 [Sporobolomyces salmonicolor]
MASRQHKKLKLASASPAPSLVECLSRLNAQLAYVDQLLQPPSPSASSATLLSEFMTLSNRLTALERALAGAVTADESKIRGYKDELDAKGVMLWNRSTALKYAREEGTANGERRAWHEVWAKLRHLSYRLIRAGTVEPLTDEEHLSLLSLSTKTSLAYLAAEQPDPAFSLLSEAAAYAEALRSSSSLNPIFTSERAKALLAHYAFRMRISFVKSIPAIAGWLKDKADTLVKNEKLPWRQVERLATTAYEIGSVMLKQKKGADQLATEDGAGTSDAIVWLEWALELLERGEGQAVHALQLATLKALVLAFLNATPAKSQWHRAEETLEQLLVLEPTPPLSRRRVRLVLARDGSDAEVVQSFVNAASRAVLSEQDGERLLSEVHRIPEGRRALRFDVLSAMVSPVLLNCSSSRWAGTVNPQSQAPRFLDQIVSTAVFFVKESDQPKLAALLDAIGTAANFRLSPDVAFLCITYIWRQGDTANGAQRFTDASDWYLLATKPVLQSIEAGTMAKSIRKAALSYLEAKQFQRADEVMQLPAAQDDLAKSHFVRFYSALLQKNKTRAIGAFRAMCTAPHFAPNQLLWAAKFAFEAREQDLLAAILAILLDMCRNGTDLAGVDLMTLSRCLVRILLNKLEGGTDAVPDECEIAPAFRQHLESALTVARTLAGREHVPESLGKDVAWLHKATYHTCCRFASEWSNDTLAPLYALVASFIDLELQLSVAVDAPTLSILWTCRYAALVGQAWQVRAKAAAEQMPAYQSLAPKLRDYHTDLVAAAGRYPQFAKDKVNRLVNASLSLQTEALVALSDWEGLSQLVDVFEEGESSDEASLQALMIIADKASTSIHCPRDVVCSIYRKTLAILYSKHALDTSSMALWLRMMIMALLQREPDEALQYVQNALQLIRNSPSDYPAEEAAWLISTSWDYGLDAYAANALEQGRAWCEKAAEIAHLADPPLAAQLTEWQAVFKERYSVDPSVGSEEG